MGNMSEACIYLAMQAARRWGRTYITAEGCRVEGSLLHLLLPVLVCFLRN